MPAPTLTDFESRARAAGFNEVLERRWPAGTVVNTHTHPFDVLALVTEGEMWLACGGTTRRLGPGDEFALARGEPHAERYGSAGAVYRAARRHRR
jgi:uncharacterized cupin superfamily protein